MGELLSNISLFVGQLYADKSLALRARDLFCFTTYLQTVIYCSTIHSFLIKDALSLNIYSQLVWSYIMAKYLSHVWSGECLSCVFSQYCVELKVPCSKSLHRNDKYRT